MRDISKAKVTGKWSAKIGGLEIDLCQVRKGKRGAMQRLLGVWNDVSLYTEIWRTWNMWWVTRMNFVDFIDYTYGL